MNELNILADNLIENEYEIAKDITNIKSYSDLKSDRSFVDQLIKGRAQLIHLLALSLKDDPDTVKEKVLEWAESAGQAAIELNAPMESTLSTSKLYRKHVWEFIRKTAIEYDLSLESVFEAASKIDPLLDDAVYVFSLCYVKHHEKVLRNTKEEFLRISSPVVKVHGDIAVLPLLGEIDADRSRILLEKTLEQAAGLRLSHLIIDLSGVTLMDDLTAQEILKITNSLRLLGVKAVLTGIQPDMAQTITQLGIDLDGIETLGTLEKAVRELI